jgi:hypothetical protein
VKKESECSRFGCSREIEKIADVYHMVVKPMLLLKVI